MTDDLRGERMARLLLDAPGGRGRSVADVVAWFGALQAQDLESVAWSLGLRTGDDRVQIDQALSSGRVLRTWPMRGTLHLIPGPDARWMLTHLGSRALAAAARRRTTLGLGTVDADRAVDALAEALAESGPLTRRQCAAAIQAAGVPTSGQRAYHLLWYASQRGVTCVGPPRGRDQTFVLLDHWAPPQVGMDRDEALVTIAQRYFRSHGPATVHDLARWADLTVTDARAAVAGAPGLHRRRRNSVELVQADDGPDGPAPPASGWSRHLPARALPGFDELVLGYRDRSAQLAPEYEPLVVPGGNGVFSPTLLLGGRVVGRWRRRVTARRVELTATAFTTLLARDRGALEQALATYASFLDKQPDIRWAALE